MRALVTISSVDYLPQSITSLVEAAKHCGPCDLIVLLVTMRNVSHHNQILNPRGIKVLNLPALADHGLADNVIYNYGKDNLRWGLKPSLMSKLLDSYESVVYIDNDILFVGDWEWLWKDVESHDVTITPHRGKPSAWFQWNNGVYNAGFVGASLSGLPTIIKWEELCAWKCEINRELGLYVDQKYLDIFPTLCNCKIVKHAGCNLAAWNMDVSIINEEGEPTVNGDPLVFVHLSNLGKAERAVYLHTHKLRFDDLVAKERGWLQEQHLFTVYCP